MGYESCAGTRRRVRSLSSCMCVDFDPHTPAPAPQGPGACCVGGNMKDKSRAELFKIVREAMYQARATAHSRDALTELERRTSIDITERLERVCEDLAAFKRAHAEHRHERDGEADWHYGMTSTPRHNAATTGAIESMRTKAEDRAWDVITKWIAKRGPYACAVQPPDEENNTWRALLMHCKSDDRVVVACTKEGTSRLDALAHLATWCEEDMHPLVEVSK